jgi:hypothetical protein
VVPRDGWDHRRPASRLDPLPGARSAVPCLVRREGTERTATELPVGMPFRGDLDVCGYSSGAERESRCGNMWRVLWKHESGKHRGTEDTEIQRLLFFVFSVFHPWTRILSARCCNYVWHRLHYGSERVCARFAGSQQCSFVCPLQVAGARQPRHPAALPLLPLP